MGAAPWNYILSPKAAISSLFPPPVPSPPQLSLHTASFFPFPSSPPFPPHPSAASVGPSGGRPWPHEVPGCWVRKCCSEVPQWGLCSPVQKEEGPCGGFLPCSWVLCSGRDGLALGLFQDRLLSKILCRRKAFVGKTAVPAPACSVNHLLQGNGK